jgi:hypothetical protein
MEVKIVETEEIQYKYGDIVVANRTCKALINGKDSVEYGYPDEEEIFEGLDKGRINFPHCILPKFSIAKYRRIKKLKIDDVIELKELDFTASIIDKDLLLDYLNVTGSISFQNIWIINTSFSIKRCRLIKINPGNPAISFRYLKAFNSRISFQEVELDSTSLDFSSSEIIKSYFNFNELEYSHNNENKYIDNLCFYAMSLDKQSWIYIQDSILRNIEIDFRSYEWYGKIVFKRIQIENSYLILWDIIINGDLRLIELSKNYTTLINSIPDISNWDKSNIFLVLKQNFNKLGHYDDEDSAYVEFKRCKAKAKLEESKKKGFFIKTCAYIKYQFSKFIFYIPGEYGTRLGNVAITMLNTVFFFSFWFYSIQSLINFKKISFCSNDIWNRLAGSIYHSLITFLTIGYGDVAPKNWLGGLLSGIEGFLGLFLMAYFTIAFSRKVLR